MFVTATSNSSGSLSVLLMALPVNLPAPTTADLQVGIPWLICCSLLHVQQCSRTCSVVEGFVVH